MNRSVVRSRRVSSPRRATTWARSTTANANQAGGTTRTVGIMVPFLTATGIASLSGYTVLRTLVYMTISCSTLTQNDLVRFGCLVQDSEVGAVPGIDPLGDPDRDWYAVGSMGFWGPRPPARAPSSMPSLYRFVINDT